MPYYGLLAAVYGDGRPVRLANDRFDQFQTGLKRHQFSMGYTVAVELRVTLPQVSDPEQAVRIVAAAHEVCPYSNATRGNIDVTLTANGEAVAVPVTA